MKKQFMLIAVPLITLFSCSNKKSDITPTQSNSGVTTYAGDGTTGLKNGTGTAAELNTPSDMVVDGAGNLYVSEQGNNVIRRIAPGGVVTIYAGDGTSGFKNGAAATAEFNRPEGLALDATGNLYVADAGNNAIRKIAPDGTVSTYAGNGTAGFVNGGSTTAEFATPSGLAIDKQKNIYVADYANNVIRKITSTGVVSTFAGSGTAGVNNGSAQNASFRAPSGLTLDPSYNLYVAESANSDIREITPGGTVSTFAAGLPFPVRVTVDGASNLYASCENNTIQKIDNTGKVSLYAGNGTPGYVDGALMQAEFNSPIGVIANTQGVVIVADGANNRIRVVTP